MEKKNNRKKLKLKSLKDRINRRTKVVYDIKTLPEQIAMFNPEIAELLKEIGQQVSTNMREKQFPNIIICEDSDVDKFRLELRELCKRHDIPEVLSKSIYGNSIIESFKIPNFDLLELYPHKVQTFDIIPEQQNNSDDFKKLITKVQENRINQKQLNNGTTKE